MYIFIYKNWGVMSFHKVTLRIGKLKDDLQTPNQKFNTPRISVFRNIIKICEKIILK